jgi:uncharacterized protein (UPF0297 family)
MENHTVKYPGYNEENISEKVKDTLAYVYGALEERGYNPYNQLIGYLITGDPTYITTHKDARKRIREVDRDDIFEELLKVYLK